ncbi:MAG: YbaB/EbfC family nucleoid-associated protein [Candidatus Stahlbacteria bacterium]|nr:MAG: YbaB/EbfC family nucleoid-associated protein [Candidatus Stahlbacteria bacterium]
MVRKLGEGIKRQEERVKNIMREAQKLQAKLLEELRKVKVEGSAGGGMVRIEMDGEQTVISVKIEPQILEDKDISMLEDLILAAFNDAKKKVTEETQESFKSITGFSIPT